MAAFRREVRRRPSPSVQHIEAVHHAIARHSVADSVVTNVPDVQSARRVGEHIQIVEFGFFGVESSFEEDFARPISPAISVDFFGIVMIHEFNRKGAKTQRNFLSLCTFASLR
jgi:hypothetical protein